MNNKMYPFLSTPSPWHCHSGSVWAVKNGREIPIAHMDREPGNGTLPVERDMNAQLIAEAPAMMEILDKIFDQMDIESGDLGTIASILRRARKQ